MADKSKFAQCCVQCTHWRGDKDKMKFIIQKYGDIVMDKDKGFPEDGRCNISAFWLSVEVHGDSKITVTVPANFGCVHHHPTYL